MNAPTGQTAVSIAVVGAGPAGLAAALALAQAGHRVALVAPANRPRDERTSALLHGSVTFLERLGVWQQLAGRAAPLTTIRIIDGTHRLIRAPEVSFAAAEIDLPAFGYNLSNADIVEALEAAVAESGVERITATADGVATGFDGVTLSLSNGSPLTARLVVAADGARSAMREAAGIAVDAWHYDQSALVCNLRHPQPHDDTSTEFHTERGPFTLVPLPGNRSSLVWVDQPAASERRLALPPAELAAEIAERSAWILGDIEIDGPRQVFPLSGLRARTFAAARIALVGEAGHVFPPIGAQGLNLGYRDVETLADVLMGASDPGSEEALAAYDRRRRLDVMSRTFGVDALNRTLLSGFLPVQAARGFGLFLLDRIPALRKAAMRQGLAVR